MARLKHNLFCYECMNFLLNLEKGFEGQVPPTQLAKLRADLDLLRQSWSVMAGRNLMNDILRGLKALESTMSSELKARSALLTGKLKKLLENHVLGKARYDSVLCLGYRVKTTFSGYQGRTDDYRDMKDRCEDLKAAIRAAHTLAGCTPEGSAGNVLKIFMAPEFYFRGRHGAYDLADVLGLEARKAEPGIAKVEPKTGIVELMAQEMSKPIYKDWLFVLGTAICATKVTRTVCKVCKGEVRFEVDRGTGKSSPVCKLDKTHQGAIEETQGAQIDNVAFVWKEGAVHTVTKELVSRIDFIKSPAQKDVVKLGTEELEVMRHSLGSGNPYTAASGETTKFQDERMGGSIFTLDGVTFGLEVCLDHAASVSSRSSGRLNHAANIQVQLIPSAGMTVGALRAVDGGVVFNVDGGTPHVQVVGGAPKAEIRYDLVSGGTQFELAYPRRLPRDYDWSVDVLAKNRPLHKWKMLPGAPKKVPNLPKVAHGNSGSVLLYGPYELPAV